MHVYRVRKKTNNIFVHNVDKTLKRIRCKKKMWPSNSLTCEKLGIFNKKVRQSFVAHATTVHVVCISTPRKFGLGCLTPTIVVYFATCNCLL